MASAQFFNKKKDPPGVGRVYQQTFVDTYSKVAQANLYNMNTALTAADLLNEKLPFFKEQNLPMLRIFTDRGGKGGR